MTGREHTQWSLGLGGCAARLCFEGEDDTRPLIIDPFAFLQHGMQNCPHKPAPDVTTETWSRIAFTCTYGDASFAGRNSVYGPYSVAAALNQSSSLTHADLCILYRASGPG